MKDKFISNIYPWLQIMIIARIGTMVPLTSFSFVHLLYSKNVVTRRGNKAKIAVAPPSSQKSCLKYIKTRKRSITTAPKGRKTLYMMVQH